MTDTLSGIDAASLQYVWTQSTDVPTGGWTNFASGDKLELENADGNWYLHVRAQDAKRKRTGQCAKPSVD